MRSFARHTIPILFAAGALAAAAPPAGPTFHRDIEPLLQKHCQVCHRPNEIAPMPLLTYAQARPWAKAIRQQVALRRMPPWFAELSSHPLANDPRLSDAEIHTIEAWADSGAPEGKASEAPPPVHWPEGWNIGKPDLVVSMPRPFHVPASGDVDYQYVIVPLNLKEDRWVSAVEVRPGAPGVVHHMVCYVRPPKDQWLRDEPAGQFFVRSGVTRNDMLVVYAPGQPPSIAPPGMARFLPAGSDLVLQIHYNANGTAADDQTRIGLVFAKTPPEKRILTLQLNSVDLHIPPGDPNYRVTVVGTLPNDCLLLSFFPHMHLRGKAFEYELDAPGGHVERLLRVHPYDFHWQLSYRLAEPLPLAKGTRLRATAWYDNSANNPSNPDPAREVTYGEQSHDEMMVGFFEIAIPAAVSKQEFFRR